MERVIHIERGCSSHHSLNRLTSHSQKSVGFDIGGATREVESLESSVNKVTLRLPIKLETISQPFNRCFTSLSQCCFLL
jgi:hypothetical protein